MITFQEFLEEGKRKKIEKMAKQIGKTVAKDIERQKKENPERSPVADYGNPAPGSVETDAAIKAMMDRDKDWRKRMKQNQNG